MSAGGGRRRALLLGCPWGTLYGVHHSLAALRASLVGRGFAVAGELCGPEVPRAAVLAALDEFVADTRPGDAAVIVYVGHGGRHEHRAHDVAAPGPPTPPAFHALLPTDAPRSTAADCRAITSFELLAVLRALVERTGNVTVILDCCHAAGLIRDPASTSELFGRTWEPAARAQIGERLHARGGAGPTRPELEVVVRIVASAALERAYEERLADGRHIGAFSRALAEVLDETRDLDLSWVDVAHAVHARVQARRPGQWIGLEGPRDRVPFALRELRRPIDSHPCHQAADGRVRVAAGWLQGVAVGDRFALQPLGVAGWPGATLATAVAAEVSACEAALQLPARGRLALPGLARAVRVAAAQPLTATCSLTPQDHRWHALHAAAQAAGVRLEPLDPDHATRPATADAHDGPATRGPLAHVESDAQRLRVREPGGSLCGEYGLGRPLAALTDLTRALARLAAWRRLQRALAERPWRPHPDELALRCRRLDAGGESGDLELSGALLRAGEVWALAVTHAGELASRLHCAAFRLTADRELVHLSAEHTHGLPIVQGERLEIGEPLAGDRRGVRFDWCATVPRDGPRDERLIFIVDARPLRVHATATPAVARADVARAEGRGPWCWQIAYRLDPGLAVT